jgi:hypothetical protein
MAKEWVKRQIENTNRNVREWPAWMRREAGIQKAEKAQKPAEKAEKK